MAISNNTAVGSWGVNEAARGWLFRPATRNSVSSLEVMRLVANAMKLVIMKWLNTLHTTIFRQIYAIFILFYIFSLFFLIALCYLYYIIFYLI